jgi:hypothetical protein
LCSFAWRIVSSVSRADHRIGSIAVQATASVPPEAVIVAQPGRISSGIGSSAARIARFANEIERMGGGLREGRYYVSQSVLKRGPEACPVGRVPAAEIETAVIDQLRGLLRAPEVIVGTWRSARPEVDGLSEAEVREALEGLDPLWDELFPAEQTRIIQLLIERVDVGHDGVDIRLRVDGLAHLVRDLGGIAASRRNAA